jgi:hypothetical protein
MYGMPTKTERLELRVDSDFLAKVDEWRRDQPDLPPRAAAIRRLVEKGLEADRAEPKKRR